MGKREEEKLNEYLNSVNKKQLNSIEKSTEKNDKIFDDVFFNYLKQNKKISNLAKIVLFIISISFLFLKDIEHYHSINYVLLLCCSFSFLFLYQNMDNLNYFMKKTKYTKTLREERKINISFLLILFVYSLCSAIFFYVILDEYNLSKSIEKKEEIIKMASICLYIFFIISVLGIEIIARFSKNIKINEKEIKVLDNQIKKDNERADLFSNEIKNLIVEFEQNLIDKNDNKEIFKEISFLYNLTKEAKEKIISKELFFEILEEIKSFPSASVLKSRLLDKVSSLMKEYKDNLNKFELIKEEVFLKENELIESKINNLLKLIIRYRLTKDMSLLPVMVNSVY